MITVRAPRQTLPRRAAGRSNASVAPLTLEAKLKTLSSLVLAAALSLAPLLVQAQSPAPLTAPDPAKPRLTLQALRAKYAEPNARFAQVGLVEVHYLDEGSGPAILMVHGSVSDLHNWDGVAAQLKAHYRVIRYDVPAQGLSGPVSDDAAAQMRPADVAEGLLTQLGIKRVTVVGVSSGSTLGVFLAAKRPDLVERLILSNAPADPVSTGHMTPSPALDAAQKEVAAAGGFQSMRFWNAFLDYFSGEPSRISAAMRERYYDMNRRLPEKNLLSLVAQVADHSKALEAMAAVKAPTLLIWGGRDPLLIPKSADVLAGYLTGTQVSKVFMPDVGHYPPMEAPDRFARLVATYIEAATPEAGR